MINFAPHAAVRAGDEPREPTARSRRPGPRPWIASRMTMMSVSAPIQGKAAVVEGNIHSYVRCADRGHLSPSALHLLARPSSLRNRLVHGSPAPSKSNSGHPTSGASRSSTLALTCISTRDDASVEKAGPPPCERPGVRPIHHLLMPNTRPQSSSRLCELNCGASCMLEVGEACWWRSCVT